MKFGAHEYSCVAAAVTAAKTLHRPKTEWKKKKEYLMIAKFLIYSFLGFFLSFRVECVDDYYYYDFFFLMLEAEIDQQASTT